MRLFNCSAQALLSEMAGDATTFHMFTGSLPCTFLEDFYDSRL